MLHVDECQMIPDIHCIFLDLDGTLMNDRKEISEANICELNRMQKMGIRLVVATGRPKATIPKLPDSIHIDYYITSNGAAIYDHEWNTVYRRDMSWDTTLRLAQCFEKDDYPEYFLEGVIHMDQEKLEQIDRYEVPPTNRRSVLTKAVHHESVTQYLEKEHCGCEKICVFFSRPFHMDKSVRLRTAALSVDGVHAVSGGPLNLEFTDVQVSKAKAVEYVLELLGLKVDQAMAFGDSENDLDLFQAVTYAVAVDNACDMLKEHAFAITRDNNSDGVAYALKKLVAV